MLASRWRFLPILGKTWNWLIKREQNASLLTVIWSKSLSSIVKLVRWTRLSLLMCGDEGLGQDNNNKVESVWEIVKGKFKRFETKWAQPFQKFAFFSFFHPYLLNSYVLFPISFIQRFMCYDQHCSSTDLFRISFFIC